MMKTLALLVKQIALQYFREMIVMEKTATLNLRVSPLVKQQAEQVLSRIGVSMATVIDIYLRQIALAGGITFPVRLPPVPENMNADSMDAEALQRTLIKGMDDAEAGTLYDAKEAFSMLRARRRA